jgi:hypothetical protein
MKLDGPARSDSQLGITNFVEKKEDKSSSLDLSFSCDPAGTRTQGPYIKSVLLYQLSYGISVVLLIKAWLFIERVAKV